MSEEAFFSDEPQDDENAETQHIPELLFGKKQNYSPVFAFSGGYCGSYIAKADDGAIVFAKTFNRCGEKYRDAIYDNERALIPLLSKAQVTAPLTDTGLREPLIIQPYIEGKNLEDHIYTTGLPSPSEARETIAPIFKKAQTMHDLGVIHRDFKPANIIIPHSHQTPILTAPLIVDFGFAKIKGQKDRLKDVFGTPLYQAPEQMIGSETDYRCDIYAGGLILYEFLAAKLPFEDEDSRIDIYRQKQRAPIREKFEDYRLSEAITKATQPDPARRFQSFNEFIDAMKPRTFWSWIASKVTL